jgi:hypothetical protein
LRLAWVACGVQGRIWLRLGAYSGSKLPREISPGLRNGGCLSGIGTLAKMRRKMVTLAGTNMDAHGMVHTYLTLPGLGIGDF